MIHESNRGLGVFVREEGSVSDILFFNIIIHTRLHTGDWWGNGEPIHVSCIPQKPGTELGRIENVRFSNILADSEHGIVVYGVQEHPIRNVSFHNVDLKVRPSSLNASFGGNFDLRPAYEDQYTLFGHDISGLYAGHVQGLRIENFRLDWPEGLPEFFTHGITCEHFRDLIVEGFDGRQALPGGERAAIALRNGSGVIIRQCRAASGTCIFLMQEDITGTRVLADNDLTSARQSITPDSSEWELASNRLPTRPAPE